MIQSFKTLAQVLRGPAWSLALLLCWAACCLPSAARAGDSEDLLGARGYWHDRTGQATIAQAQAQTQTLTPFEGIFSRGFSDGAHWLKLTLAASTTPVALRLSPSWVDEITVFDPAQAGKRLTAGDHHPQGVTAIHGLGYHFILPAGSTPRDLWIQLRSTNSHRLHIQALPADQLPSADTLALVWTALYAAVLLLMLLALASVYWVQPEAVLGVYLVRHLNYMFYGVGYLGLTGLLVPQDLLPYGWLDKVFSLSVVLTLPLGLWFEVRLLSTYQPHRLWLLALKALAWGSLLMVVLMLAGYARWALQITVNTMMLAVLVFFGAAWSCKPDPTVERLMPKKVLLGYYTLVLGSLLIGLLTVVGIKQPEAWSNYLLVLHGLVTGLFMTVILFVRGQRQFRFSEQMRWQLHKTQQEMALEQRRRDEQSQFLHMLMHELKTPLSIVSLALGTQNNREENLEHASRAVKAMKAIIDRCVQADQMGQLSLTLETQPVDLPSLIGQIAQGNPSLHGRMRLKLDPDCQALRTDAQLLQIVLTNLMDNAAHYSDPHTPILVDAVARREQHTVGVRLRIANTPGLAGWPDAAQLFGKYYRASGAQRESGSGLGLYLSRQLAQSLGGTLDYRPDEHHVAFELWIPLNTP